jgi:predicted RNA-binding protein Jag
MANSTLQKLGAGKPRIVIDTNKHGIRRETNLDKLASKANKRKAWENRKKNA